MKTDTVKKSTPDKVNQNRPAPFINKSGRDAFITGKSPAAISFIHCRAQQGGCSTTIQKDTEPGESPSCNDMKIFTEFVMPTGIDNRYFENSHEIDKEGDWRKNIDSYAVGRCKIRRDFDDVKLEYNMKNKNLGTFYFQNLNVGDFTIDIRPVFIFSGDPCFECIAGTLSWNFTIEINRYKGTKSGKPESGKSIGVKGNKKAGFGDCEKPVGCSFNKKLDVFMREPKRKKPDTEVEVKIDGHITYSGQTLKED